VVRVTAAYHEKPSNQELAEARYCPPWASTSAQERAMNDDLVNCPLCHGHAQLRRSELIARLADTGFREKVEKHLAELNERELAGVGTNRTRDFQKEVHSWNPQLPIWRRSPKE
jgi:hypothetical protein